MTAKPKPRVGVVAAECFGKHRYASAALAHGIAGRSRRHEESRVGAYRCKVCGGWHIGEPNQPRSISRRRP